MQRLFKPVKTCGVCISWCGCWLTLSLSFSFGQVKPWVGVCTGWCCAPWLVTDGSQCWQARRKTRCHIWGRPPAAKTRVFTEMRFIGGSKLISAFCPSQGGCSVEEKVGVGRARKNFSRLSAQLSPRFHVWHNRLGLTRRKFEQGRKVLGAKFSLRTCGVYEPPVVMYMFEINKDK